MTSPFTEHLRSSKPDAYPSTAVQDALLRILRTQMRRRGLSRLPPAYLGYSQYQTWREEGAEDELLLDCYLFAVGGNRWPLLCKKLDEFGNVDGIVHRNVANFLTERQKRHDPVGYAVFKNLEGAVRQAIELGTVTTANLPGGKVRNGTILQFDKKNTTPTDPAQLVDVLQALDNWPQVEQQLVRISIQTQSLLRRCLEELGEVGVSQVIFGDLVEVSKAQARSCHTRVYGPGNDEVGWEGDGDAAQRVPLANPDLSADDCDNYAAMVQCIADHISRIKQKRVRDCVQMIFCELTDAIARGDDVPKQAEIVRLLEFPRSTVSDVFTRLEEFTENCRAKLG